MGLRKRTNFVKPWLVKNYFPKGHHLFVDSGCQVINSANEEKYSNEELKEIAERYYSWVTENLEEIELFSEFDAVQLGEEYLKTTRDTLSKELLEKFLPVWHVETGLAELQRLGVQYHRVGISQTNLSGRDLIPLLNRMISDGIELHGLAMTKIDIMQAVKWTSITSTSWTTPQRYGATIIWSHNQLKRYSKDDKNQARKKERSVFLANGFDIEKIEQDNPAELLRMALWSWEQLVNSINRKQEINTTVATRIDSDSNYQIIGEEGVVVGAEVSNNQFRPATPRTTQTLPVMSTEVQRDRVKNHETGEYEDKLIPKLRIRSESLRICDTCFLASKCPMFEPGSTCAYDIPVVVRTKDQLQALADSLVEMQAQRVLFMKMAEDIEGGYADPNLSMEIDRLGRLLKTKTDMEQEGFQLTVTAKQNRPPGVMDRIFGDLGDVSKLRELEAPIEVPDFMANLGIIDAELVDLPRTN